MCQERKGGRVDVFTCCNFHTLWITIQTVMHNAVNNTLKSRRELHKLRRHRQRYWQYVLYPNIQFSKTSSTVYTLYICAFSYGYMRTVYTAHTLSPCFFHTHTHTQTHLILLKLHIYTCTLSQIDKNTNNKISFGPNQ